MRPPSASLALAACGGDDDGRQRDRHDGHRVGERRRPRREGDGTLTIGTPAPADRHLAFLGPPEFAGVDLAVKEINEAGGVLGEQVAYIEGDSGDTSTDIANPDRRPPARGRTSTSSSVPPPPASRSPSSTRSRRPASSSSRPANTSPDFTDYDDNGLYFRTAPSDVLQGRILGERSSSDGSATSASSRCRTRTAPASPSNVGDAVTGGGGEVVDDAIIYDPAAANFDAEVSELKAANPDAIVLIGFDESAKVIQSMVAAGHRPAAGAALPASTATWATPSARSCRAGVLAGMKGTTARRRGHARTSGTACSRSTRR